MFGAPLTLSCLSYRECTIFKLWDVSVSLTPTDTLPACHAMKLCSLINNKETGILTVGVHSFIPWRFLQLLLSEKNAWCPTLGSTRAKETWKRMSANRATKSSRNDIKQETITYMFVKQSHLNTNLTLQCLHSPYANIVENCSGMFSMYSEKSFVDMQVLSYRTIAVGRRKDFCGSEL